MKDFFKHTLFSVIIGLAGGMLVFPSTAMAHLVTTGLGPVYDGIGHLVMTPEDLIPTLALAFYCGLRGAKTSRYAIFVLPLAWFMGGMIGIMSGLELSVPVPLFSFVLLGLLVAADVALPPSVVAPLAALIGLLHGFFNGIVLKSGPGISGLLGIMAALFVLVTLLSAIVISLEKPWTRIVVRVLGSWIAASGMLMIGWYLKGAA